MPFDIKICKFCDRPFQSTGGRVCDRCLREIDQDLIKIKEYIYENPDIAMGTTELAEATEVRREVILYLLEEKRLEFKWQHGGDGPMCEMCRRPISGGRFCSNCQNSLSKALEATVPRPADRGFDDKKGKGQMHLNHTER